MRETGSKVFQDNKIRSCSYVKEDKDGNTKAIPFYDKRNSTVYPTKSDFARSWSASIHGQPKALNAGMGSSKPLTPVNYLFYFFSTIQWTNAVFWMLLILFLAIPITQETFRLVTVTRRIISTTWQIMGTATVLFTNQ